MEKNYSLILLTFSNKKLILEALEAYKDTDNEEYNEEINELIKKLNILF